MEHNFLYLNCPICGKQLLELNWNLEENSHNYYCDQCHIEISVKEDRHCE